MKTLTELFNLRKAAERNVLARQKKILQFLVKNKTPIRFTDYTGCESGYLGYIKEYKTSHSEYGFYVLEDGKEELYGQFFNTPSLRIYDEGDYVEIDDDCLN